MRDSGKFLQEAPDEKALGDIWLNFEELATVTTQVEALNSRPLVPLESASDPEHFDYLTCTLPHRLLYTHFSVQPQIIAHIHVGGTWCSQLLANSSRLGRKITFQASIRPKRNECWKLTTFKQEMLLLTETSLNSASVEAGH